MASLIKNLSNAQVKDFIVVKQKNIKGDYEEDFGVAYDSSEDSPS